jgi:[ribosomal protein S5]-alanine N-acetyltransferase
VTSNVPRRPPQPPPTPEPDGPRVGLRLPTAADRDRFLAAVAASRALHHPWVEPPDTPEKYAAWLRRLARPTFASWLVVRRDGAHDLVGWVSLNNMVWGSLGTAQAGYAAFVAGQGQGLMADALTLAVQAAFGSLRLHRVEANIQPRNVASLALARRCGFRYEGFSPRFMRIGGVWCDHERWAVTADDPGVHGDGPPAGTVPRP